MKFNTFFAMVLVGLASLPAIPAAAFETVTAKVDLSDQQMTVFVDGWPRYHWDVSTARRGKITPVGNYTAQFLSRYHRSSRYNNAPMPYSIFFNGHYAIHGTDQISRLGRPASAGCVRLHPDNAAILFALTQQVGKDNLHVSIVP